jgi:anthranilate/para-aminobenzoate synthase component II
MSEEKLALHAHDFVIASETYKNSKALSEFFNILAVDEEQGTEFVMAVEAKDYPIAGTMNHPET